MIDHRDACDPILVCGFEYHLHFIASVAAGIGDEIEDALVQPGSIAAHHRCRVRVVAGLDATVRMPGGQVVDHVADDRSEVDGFEVSAPVDASARELQHVLDHVSQPRALATDSCHRTVEVAGFVEHVAGVQVAVAAQRGEWCPQFVRGIGEEAPHVVACLRRVGEGGGQAIHHPFEIDGEVLRTSPKRPPRSASRSMNSTPPSVSRRSISMLRR